MSYIAALHRRTDNEVIVWERTNGKRVVKHYPAPLYFYTEHEDGQFTSIFGKKLERQDFSTYDEFYSAKQKLKRLRLYESDITPDIKVLSEHYYNAELPNLNVTMLDIEVDYNPLIGFSSTSNPYAPINAIAIHHMHTDRSIVIAVPPPGWNVKLLDQSLLKLSEIVLVKNEKELLSLMLDEFVDSDVLSGWNSDTFDIPYIAKRIEKTLGKSALRRLSFDGADMPRYREVEIFKQAAIMCDLSGRVHLDYLNLFRKYEVSERPSYKLESIADEVLPHLPKLEYEGSLASLYRNDFNHFLRYNIRDTEILKGFEQKLGYIALANVMCHTSTSQFKDVFGTLKLSDFAVVNYCHYELDVKVPDWSEKPDGNIQGAYVLLPQIGMHEWIGSIDINSLYPSAIRSINISPETLIGQFIDNVHAWEEIAKGSNEPLMFDFDDGKEQVETAADWRVILQENKWAVSGYGTVFNQNKQGIVPTILASWYKQRKEFQKQKNVYYELAQNEPDKEKQAELIDKSKYYDRLQYVYKIKLNSFYGALTNYYFRFFDLRMGESTTGTGRAVLRHQIRKTAEILDGNYNINPPLDAESFAKSGGIFPSESIIYGDTDSVYFKTHGQNQQEATQIADATAELVNRSYQPFMKQAFLCNPGFDDIIKCGREVVSDRGIFVDKKRYVLHLVDLDGHHVDKMKIMGLELKKTTLPKPIAKRLSSFIERLLKGDEWSAIESDIVEFKTSLDKTTDVMTIGLPKGVKGVEDYTFAFSLDEKTRLPGHVAASIMWNRQLDEHQDKESMRITSNMKIKVFYLTRTFGRFKSIAVPTDLTTLPPWFIEKFLPIIDRDAQLQRLVDDTLQHIFTAINKTVPTPQSMFVDSILDF